ncbi:MAG: hypothetical protein Q8S54_06800 [Bacteroidota bacterium]|nr:hypothetical protein [Bacteroidota bacterium]
MYYLIGIIVLTVIVYAVIRFSKKKQETLAEPDSQAEVRNVASDCCGAHEICEFDTSVFDQDQIIYFDDEELDELRNVREEQLTEKQIEDLRDVLYTLQTNEIGKWITSLASRHIHLPAILQQEARQLMTEI